MDDLRDFISSEIKVDIRNLTTVSDPTWTTQSFRLGLPANQLDSALNANWPANICVRKWRYVPKKGINSGDPKLNTDQ